MTEKPMTVAEVANFLRRSIKSVLLRSSCNACRQ